MSAKHSRADLEAVDRQLADGFRALVFCRDLERQFEADKWIARKRYLFVCGISALVLYDLFLVSDYDLMPDIFVRACINRLAIFTPLAAFGMILGLRRSATAQAREWVIACINIVAVTLIGDLFAHSTSANRIHCCHGVMLIIIFSTVVQRGRFRYVLMTSVAMLVVTIRVFAQSDALNGAVLGGTIAFYLTGTSLLLATAYALEYGQRRSYLLALRSDILNEQLERSGKLDPLTGLWNRRHLNAAMATAWAEAIATPQPVAVVLIDIDHFKAFNDVNGHLEGDTCLQAVAAIVRRTVGTDDAIAVRYGGEEFLVFIRGADDRAIFEMASNIHRAVKAERIAHRRSGPDAVVTVSIGIAAGHAPHVTPAALIAAADRALYTAKDDGRDCIRRSVLALPHDLHERRAAAA